MRVVVCFLSPRAVMSADVDRQHRRPVAPPDSAGRKTSTEPLSISMTNTPWGPSVEWAISRSTMLASRSVARLATSATTPGRSGTGMRTSRRSAGVRNRAGRLTRAARALSSRSRARPGRPWPRGRASRRAAAQIVEYVDDGGAVLGADVGPDPRVPRGDAGHVAEATRGEAEQRPVLLAALVGQAHQGGRRQVRDVRHHRHQLVVPVGRQGDDLGPQGADHLADPGEGAGVGPLGGRQHPGGALEQVGRRPRRPPARSRPSGGRRRSGRRPRRRRSTPSPRPRR